MRKQLRDGTSVVRDIDVRELRQRRLSTVPRSSGQHFTPPDSSETGSLADVLAAELVSSVFQPIIDLDSLTVVGYEALARGPHGPLARPDALFAAAASAGRLVELDSLCQRAAVRGAVDAGLYSPLTVFINIEPEVATPAGLGHLLQLAAAAPSELRFVLELTERALTAQPAGLLATVQALRAAGWRIALDDVGANDATLTFMSLLQPDIIKLDMQLVQRRASPAVAEIMNAVNAHAERTGCLLLAEGIENAEHLATARTLGARLGQGWLFGRPAATATDRYPAGALDLPPIAVRPTPLSPFTDLPASTPLRLSRKPLLIEISKHLERQAARLGSSCIVASTFQKARHFTPITEHRYHDLASRVGFVAALGADLPIEPAPGVRGATLQAGDPLLLEWDIVVLAPHFACALIARDCGDSGPQADRRFEFVLTYDRAAVTDFAVSLLSRIGPRPPALG